MNIKEEVINRVSYSEKLEYTKAKISWIGFIGVLTSCGLMSYQKNLQEGDFLHKLFEATVHLEIQYNILTYGLLIYSVIKILHTAGDIKIKDTSIDYIKKELGSNGYNIIDKKEPTAKALYNIYATKNNFEYYLSNIQNQEFILTKLN